MPDRKKVINGLEWILNDIKENGHYQVDNYEDEIREALVLLKAQEPAKPRYDRGYRDYNCPVCGVYLLFHQKYCNECGKALQWE